MNPNKMILISISFVLATMLLSSGNMLNLSYAQSNTLSQSNEVDQTNDGNGDQTNTGDDDNNNSDRQNYLDFERCLEEEAGTADFATEQQIRDCFAPIYISGNNDDSSSDDDN